MFLQAGWHEEKEILEMDVMEELKKLGRDPGDVDASRRARIIKRNIERMSSVEGKFAKSASRLQSYLFILLMTSSMALRKDHSI